MVSFIEKVCIVPIPPLQPNGTLPPGEYQATITEIVTMFPPITVERQELNQALQDALPALIKLQTLAPDMIVYIDGSFVTSKQSPNDVDILILTDVFDEIEIRDFFNNECPIPATYFDIHADPVQRRHLVNVFTRTRSNQPKGIIVLSL